MEWQSIETAPKDGSEFSAWIKEYNLSDDRSYSYWAPYVMFHDGEWKYKHSHGWFPMNMQHWIKRVPTHWMPLPDPPQ